MRHTWSETKSFTSVLLSQSIESLSVGLTLFPSPFVCVYVVYLFSRLHCLSNANQISLSFFIPQYCLLPDYQCGAFQISLLLFFLFHTWILVLVSRLHESFLTVMVSLFCPANLYLGNTWGSKSVKYLCGRGTMWLLYLNFISLSSWSCCHILLWINIHIHLLLQQETLSRQPHSLCSPPSWPALCTCVSLMNRQ